MVLRAFFFGILYFCVCEFFYFLIRSGGADMELSKNDANLLTREGPSQKV
jgi:hypothetical protein